VEEDSAEEDSAEEGWVAEEEGTRRNTCTDTESYSKNSDPSANE
jgi:hypothetical protein